ncbi:unnamed protein product [Ectocarpus sp. CCAP 1310/34]|nr:unnamed protein product [Ectocarpus sp. CCAP 1310/34]
MPRKNSNRVANVKKRARRPKGRPPERAWAQTLAQMKAAAAAAARRKSLRTRGGETFVRLRNGGFSNSCGPICLLQHAMSDSLPIATIERATNGEIASEVRGALRYIRDITVDTSHGHTLSVLDPDEEREVHGFEDLVDSAERDILSKPMWDKIMRCPYGYFDGRAMMIGADALGLDGLLIVRVDSAGFLVAMDGMTTPVAEAKHLVLWDGYAHFEALFPDEEVYPVFPDLGEEFFFDGHAQAEEIVDVEELPPVADIVDEWDKYLSTSTTSTRGVDESVVATNSNAGLASHVVDHAGGHASSSPAGILFAYTGFAPGLPGESRRCRLIRGRRYRAGTSSGLSRQALRRTAASVRQILAMRHPPPEPPACRWTNKSVVLGAVYITSVMAPALSCGFAIAPIIFVSMLIWAAVGFFLTRFRIPL